MPLPCRMRVIRRKAFFRAPTHSTNPEHIKFALKGCLAASLCYKIIYHLPWTGEGSAPAVLTCILTALTTNWIIASKTGLENQVAPLREAL